MQTKPRVTSIAWCHTRSVFGHEGCGTVTLERMMAEEHTQRDACRTYLFLNVQCTTPWTDSSRDECERLGVGKSKRGGRMGEDTVQKSFLILGKKSQGGTCQRHGGMSAPQDASSDNVWGTSQRPHGRDTWDHYRPRSLRVASFLPKENLRITFRCTFDVVKNLNISGEIQIKATMSYHITLLKMTIIRTNKKCWRGCGEKGIHAHHWWDCELVQPLWKTVQRILQKLQTELRYDTAIPLLGIYQEIKSKS